MPWTVIDARKDAQPGSADEDKVSIRAQWVDSPEAEFTADDPFVTGGRVDPANVGERNAFKTEIETRRETERTRRQNRANPEVSFLYQQAISGYPDLLNHHQLVLGKVPAAAPAGDVGRRINAGLIRVA